MPHFTILEQQLLSKTLTSRIKVFQEKMGNWKGKPVNLELRPEAELVASRPFSIPQSYRNFAKEELKRLVEIGLLTPVFESKWSSPSFMIPKKDKTVRFLTNFRSLNKKLVRKSYPLLVIQDSIQGIGSFKWATCIEPNMGYYSMELDKTAKNLCVTCLPWGLYRYNMLPMGIKVTLDVFQSAILGLFINIEGVIVYIDDIIIIGAGIFG